MSLCIRFEVMLVALLWLGSHPALGDQTLDINEIVVDQSNPPILITITGRNLTDSGEIELLLGDHQLVVLTRSDSEIRAEWPEGEPVESGIYRLVAVIAAEGAEGSSMVADVAEIELAARDSNQQFVSRAPQQSKRIMLNASPKWSLAPTRPSIPTRPSNATGVAVAPQRTFATVGAAGDSQQSPLFSQKLNPGSTLKGFVDMHTHPMAYLGFGGKLIHGAPDVGVLMPAGAIYNPSGVGTSGETCNAKPRDAVHVSEALGTCYSSHGGHDIFANKCGNHVRRVVLDEFENGQEAHKPHSDAHPKGYPAFSSWPRHDDILHQLMWVDWIERAYEGGMRVMVALAVNNYTLARGIEADGPIYDSASADLQINELKRMVNKHSWMQIAYSQQDLKEIVGKKDMLAVIIGVEIDDMGDFLVHYKTRPGPGAVRSEIRRLHGLGVRYVFPVHVTDNYFGGTAVYEDDFNTANCVQYGSFWKLSCTGDPAITHKVASRTDLMQTIGKTFKFGACGLAAPIPLCPMGHVNSRGLNNIGVAAIDEMMRLGMIIDIDHASQKTVAGILNHTDKYGYPVVSGHNALRGQGWPRNKCTTTKYCNESLTENNRTEAQYKEIASRGGIAGVGWGGGDAAAWLASLKEVRKTGVTLAFGSDINGLVKLPAPRAQCRTQACVKYGPSFPQARFENKTWNYNTEGVAHIGLFPDLLRDIEGMDGGSEVVNQLFDGAEGFARMWGKANDAIKKVPPAPPGLTVLSAQYGANCNIPASTGNITKFAKMQCDGQPFCNFKLDWAPWGGRDPNPSTCKKQLILKWQCPDGKRKLIVVLHQVTPQPTILPCP